MPMVSLLPEELAEPLSRNITKKILELSFGSQIFLEGDEGVSPTNRRVTNKIEFIWDETRHALVPLFHRFPFMSHLFAPLEESIDIFGTCSVDLDHE